MWYIKNKKPDTDNSKEEIIKPLDVTIEPGKVTLIMGRSGSGKTTLLSVLAGLLKPSEGTVFYDDTDIYKEKDNIFSQFRNRYVGFIPQGQSLIQNLTVKENILLPAGIGNKSDRREIADALIKELDLLARANNYPRELSGGEIRRCAIARALINDPKVIFADEPTGDLDDHNTDTVFELLRKKANEGAAVVIVTHEESAPKYADTVYRMDGGYLTQTTLMSA